MNQQQDSETVTQFKKARDVFVATISEQDKQNYLRCESPEQLIASLQAPAIWLNKPKKWGKALKRIQAFGDSLRPYFDIISIVLQSNPQWSMIAWGAIRLMLMLTSNYTSFFEQLTDMLERISKMMPVYNEIMKHAGGLVSEQFRKSLQSLYSDLLEFIASVTRIFSNNGGKLRNSASILTNLLWQPFEIRFANFCRRLEFHREFLSQEMQSIQMKGTALALEQLDNEKKQLLDIQASMSDYRGIVQVMQERNTEKDADDRYQTLSDFLNPARDNEEFDRAVSCREDGTSEWIFDEDTFKWWCFSSDPSDSSARLQGPKILWVTGMPGSGKSVLAAAVVQHLYTAGATTTPTVLFHFFSYVNPTKASISFAMRALLSQALTGCRREPQVLETFSFAMHVAKERGRTSFTQLELKQLLRLVLGRIGHGYVVLDGLDESEDPDTTIKYISEAISNTNFNLVVFSRPNVTGFKNLSHMRLEIDPRKTDADITVFLQLHIEALYDDDLISEDFENEAVLRHLLTGANGMFLWARLMISYLRSPALSPYLRQKAILEARKPERLDDMYFRILHLISTKIKEEQQLARQVFKWVAHGMRQLDPAELLCTITETSKENHGTGTIIHGGGLDLQHAIIMSCGSLVELSCGKFRFVHKSVQEFFNIDCIEQNLLKESTMLSEKFRPTKAQAHCELATDCLSYLLFHAPASPLSGDIFLRPCAETVKSGFAFIQYASCYWVSHLDASMPENFYDIAVDSGWFARLTSMTSRLSIFLKTQLVLMSWLETLYLFLPLKDHGALYTKLLPWADWIQWASARALGSKPALPYIKLGETLHEFYETLQKYYELWSEVLHADPQHIWQDITGYSPTPFFRSTKATEVKSMAASRPKLVGQSTKPLTSLSRQCTLSNSLAVLTVWPSRSFEILWEELQHGVSHLEIQNQCDHWLVMFELWDVASSSREPRDQFEFVLARDAVETQLQNYIASVKSSTTASKLWALPFPLTIAAGLQSFTVLSEIFAQRSGEDAKSLWMRLVLPKLAEDQTECDVPTITSQRPSAKSHTRSKSASVNRWFEVCPLYSIEFHDNSETVLLQEKRTLSTQPDNSTIHRLEVFSLNKTETGHEYQSQGFIGGKSCSDSFGHCSFHPSLPILLLSRRRLLRGCSIEVCSYATQGSASTIERGELPVLWKYSVPTGIEALSFSTCGTQVVAKLCGSSRPITISIDANLLSGHTGKGEHLGAKTSHGNKRGCDVAFDQELDFEDKQLERIQNSQLIEKGSSLITSVSSQQLTISNHGITTISYGTSSKRKKGEIALVQRSGCQEVVQPLTRVPKWDGIERFRSQLKDPTIVATATST